MKKYEPKQFNIGELKGLSKESIDDHLKLYEGYVKHTNLILEELDSEKSKVKSEKEKYADSEMQRRLGFEFNGMKNHEIYFDSLSDGAKEIDKDSGLYKKIEEEWGSFEIWLEKFKSLAKTRGVGWAILYFDEKQDKLLNVWVGEQHLGHLSGSKPILALDVWEHSFVFDYKPSGKGQYIEDFFQNLNWSKIEDNYNDAL
jgi:Fe-Mn family superoxide dismutase